MLGPTGIGVLWGTEAILDATPPFLTGGEMILNVTKEGFTPNELPWKFEAGTPPIAEAVGLGAAVDYLAGSAWRRCAPTRCAHRLRPAHAHRAVRRRPGDPRAVRAGRAGRRAVLHLRDLHPHDLTQVFDERGCAASGHHCAKPLMRELGVAATARASLYVYNDESDVDALLAIAAAGDFFALHADRIQDPMPGLEDLYRGDHPRPLPQPANRGELSAPPATRVEGFNPLCGDEIVLFLDVDGDVVRDIRIAARGARSASRRRR